MSDAARRSRPGGGGFRVLLSVFACEPGRGSERGVGWRWAVALARAGHEVWALTRVANRAEIEAALERQPVANLHLHYYELPALLRWVEFGGRGVRVYYFLWQIGVFAAGRALHRELRFDVVHHLTFGVFRTPSLLAFLGAPFVFGPLGGGERAPLGLRRGYPLRGQLSDALRDVANALAYLNPLLRAAYRRSALILCKTPDTLRRIPAGYRGKCALFSELGVDAGATPAPGAGPAQPRSLRVLFLGRLLYWKGGHLGLEAFARFRRDCPGATLTVIGRGPEEKRWRRLARRLGLDDGMTWVPWVAHAEALKAYAAHDVLLFPSLHDSSGNVVLEALSNGLPVVCLNLGGPAALVDDSCALRIDARRRGAAVAGLAGALRRLGEDPALAARMGEAGRRAALHRFDWKTQVGRMEGLYRLAVCGGADPDTLSRAETATR